MWFFTCLREVYDRWLDKVLGRHKGGKAITDRPTGDPDIRVYRAAPLQKGTSIPPDWARRPLPADDVVPRNSDADDASTAMHAFSLPASYPVVTVHRTRETVRSLTKASIDALLSELDPNSLTWASIGYWQAANAWTAIINFDLSMTTRHFEAIVFKALSKHAPFINEFNDDTLWWALACLQAAKAYPSYRSACLRWAMECYEHVCERGLIRSKDFNVSTEEYGRLKCKSSKIRFLKMCNGKSMLGGVYWKSDRHDPNINAVSTGLFAQVAAEMSHLTGDKALAEQALISLLWIESHMQDVKTGLVMDHMDGRTGAVTGWIFTYNTGLVIASYARLAALSNDSELWKKVRAYIVDALRMHAWNRQDGLINEGEGDLSENNDAICFKSVLVRALVEVLFLTQDIDLVQLIEEYLLIQYHGVTELNADSRTQPLRYGRNWTGSRFLYSQIGHACVLDLLTAVSSMSLTAFSEAESNVSVCQLWSRA